MKRTSWFTYFSSAYGTCWLILLAAALITSSRINTGLFGLIGFPLVGIVYAIFRRSRDAEQLQLEITLEKMTPDFAQFLADNPSLTNAAPLQQARAYGFWLSEQQIKAHRPHVS